MIHIAQPIIEAEEIRAVNEVLQSGMLAQGSKVAELETEWAKYCGTKHALAVSSGTAAIHCALFAAGVKPGDEVITTPFSFIATVNPILMIGAEPVFVDIDRETFNIDIAKIERVITNKTKAIMPVHLYGQPADMDEMRSLAKKYKLKIIEDACQAVGAEYKGKKTGSLGDLGCFSLYATKNIMCGEGGIVTTNNDKHAKLIKEFRQHGMTGPYQYAELGYNYRMTDLQAAIAIEQLKKAERFNNKRKQNALLLNKELDSLLGIKTPLLKNDRTHAYHQYTIVVDFKRDLFVEGLRKREVGAAIYYPKALHEYQHIAKLGYKYGDFPKAEEAAKKVVSLPVHPELTKEDVSLISSSVKEVAGV